VLFANLVVLLKVLICSDWGLFLYVGELFHEVIRPLEKGLGSDGHLVDEPRSIGIPSVEDLCDLERVGITLNKGLRYF
jgi:hypothetical protein